MGMSHAFRSDRPNIPTYYVTDLIKEDAGNGVARIWNCAMYNGVIVPQCEILIHSNRLIHLAREASSFANELYQREMTNQLIAAGPAH